MTQIGHEQKLNLLCNLILCTMDSLPIRQCTRDGIRATDVLSHYIFPMMLRSFYRRVNVLFAACMLSGCIGYVPAVNYQSDSRVDELCKKDGGTEIFETLELPTEEYERNLIGGELWLPRTNGSSTKLEKPIYVRGTALNLQAGNPAIYRSELSIVRGSDHKVLATRVSYSREYNAPGRSLRPFKKHECPPPRPDEEFFAQVVKER